MAVTRLERKAQRNKSKAKVRVRTIKRHTSKVTVESPYKEESGVIIGDVEEVLKNYDPSAKAAPKAKKKEAAPTKEELPKSDAKAVEDKSTDDLTKVEGIGPKIQEALNAAGINTYADLAGKDADSLKEILTNASSRLASHDPTTWPEQAGMAAEGKWDELKKWQDELDGGREK